MKASLYTADYVVTMDSEHTVIKHGGVLVEHGKIKQLGKASELAAQHPDVPVKAYENRLLMPGLINTHCHSGMLRGTAEGLPVWDWLQQYIDPMHKVLTPEEASLSSWLCYAEALLSGTSCIVDMWRYICLLYTSPSPRDA